MVDLYHGGQYKLYKYREYTDVRLVFSPGDQAAFFGGDPDNFNFPRYDLDCAFLRLYEDGRPAATPQHLGWNPAPPTAGQPVFVAGNPGGTFREQTVAELEAQRDVTLPLNMAELSELRGRMIRFSEESPANARMVDEPLMDLENDYKVVVGRLVTLDDAAFMARQAQGRGRPARQGRCGVGRVARRSVGGHRGGAERNSRALCPLSAARDGPAQLSPLFGYARDLVRAAQERQSRPTSACRVTPTASSRWSRSRCSTPRRSSRRWSS